MIYLAILRYANWIGGGLLCLSLVLLIPKIINHFYGVFPAPRFPQAKTHHKFAILVPARNESQVIADLLQSFAQCDYPHDRFDVYVIVESADDPTCAICQRYDFVTCFVRPNLDVKSKGGALDQMVRHLIQTGTAAAQGYEAYFIFDADNVVAPHYLSEMNNVFDAGYDIALGYRNARNWNDGWVASCSAVTFSLINTFQNKGRARFAHNVLVSGTGFYIRADVLHQLGGWPFTSLTEDVEISYYATLHNLQGAYQPAAEFFDEQPTTLALSCRQRLRWVKGYGHVVKRYAPALLQQCFTSRQHRAAKWDFTANILPVALPIATVVVYLLLTLVLGIVGLALRLPLAWCGLVFAHHLTVLGLTYLFLLLDCALMLAVEHRRNNLTVGNAIKTCLMYPLFMALYLPIAVVAFFKREVVWSQIQHQKEPSHAAK